MRGNESKLHIYLIIFHILREVQGNIQIVNVENELDVSLTKREHKREKSGS